MHDATDFRNLAELSSDALVLVMDGLIVYANPAAQDLLAPAAQAAMGGLQGMAAASVWQPEPLADAAGWKGTDQLPPTPVKLLGATALPLELAATRSTTGGRQAFCVRIRHATTAADGLASRVNSALFLSPDAAMVVDARTLVFLDANPAACALMGMTLEEMRRRGPTTLRRRDGSGNEDFHALYAELIKRSPQALTHEYDFLRDDGRTVPVAATRQALNVDGRWLIFITWRDISANVATQAQRELFQAAFEQATDAICIVDVQALSYLYFNDAFQKLTGTPAQDIAALGPAGLARRFGNIGDVRPFYADVVARHPETIVREEGATRPDGTAVQLEIRHRAMHSGGRWLILSTRIDITARKRQQRHLERITAAFDASGDGIYIIDPRTFAYVDVNEAAARMHGVSRDELRALGVRGAFGNRFDEAGLRARYDELISRFPDSLTEERQIPRSDGRVVWAESIRRAIRVDGEWLVISVMRDITERRAAQARLELLKAAIDAAPDAILVIDPATLDYIDVNEAAAQLTALPRARMLASGITGVFQDEEARRHLREVYAKVIAQSPQPDIETRPLRRPDGSERMVEATRRAVRVDDRWIIVSVNRDITQRLAAQAQLELLLAAVDAAPDAIAVVDPDTFQYVHVNDAVCRLHGLPLQEVMKRGMLGMFPQFTPQLLRQRYDDLIAMAPQAVSEERVVRRPDGSTILTEAVRRAARVGDRWLVISVARDITQRKAEQTRLNMLKAAIDLAPDSFYLIDPEKLEYVEVNRAAGSLYGLTREQVLDMGMTGLLKWLGSFNEGMTPERLRESYAELIANHPQAQTQERTQRTPDGRRVHTETVRQAVQVDGRWLVVNVTRDITERKAAQARMERFAAIVSLSADAVFVVQRDSMRIVDVNDAACRMYGYTREQLTTMPPHLHKDGGSLEELEKLYDEMIRTSPATSRAEIQAIRADGSRFPAEAQRQAVRADGEWVIVITVRDLTERKAAQARIERFAAVVNMSPDAVMLIDRSTMQVIDVNEATCAMHGCTRDEMMALPVHLTLQDTTRDELAARYDAVIRQSPAVVHEEVVERRPDGSTFAAEVRRQALLSDGAWVMVVTVRDLSERKAALARIERFAAIVNLSADALFVIDRESMNVVDVNDSACRMYDYSREQLIGHPVHRLTRTYQEAAARMAREYDEVIAQSPRVTVTEVEPRRADGRSFHAEVQRMAIRSEGRWLVVTTVRDITERKLAQERIGRFAAVLNLSADAVLLVDRASMRIIDVNEAACRLHGYTREELLALPPHLSRGSTTLQQLEADYDEAIRRSPEVIHAELVAQRADGSHFVAEVQRQALQSGPGGGWIIAITARDVTQRKAAEAGLRQLKAVVDVAPDGMYIVDADSGEYIDLNHAAGRLYGLSREEVLGMGMTGFMRWLNNHDANFTLDGVRERHNWLIQNYPQVHTSERRVRLPGRPDIVTETLRQAVQVDGRWLILIVVRDITERKAAQDRIERFAAIVNLSADAVLVFDRTRMSIIDVNETACRMYGHTRDTFLALPPHRGRTGATQEDLERQFDDAIHASPAVIRTEITAMRADGSSFPAEVHRQAIRSEDGWLVVATVRDITERKAAQLRMERFAAVVNLSADGVFVVDRETLRTIDVNEAACRMYGYTREDLLALRPNANRPGMSTADLEALYDETIARSPEIHYMEHDAVRCDGSVFQAETHRLAIQSDGRWLILATVRDITERKRAEAEIRRRVAELELLRQAYDAAVDVIMIADPETLEYYDVNQAAVQMLGVPRETLLAGGVESSYYSTANEPFNPDRMRKGYQYVISRAPEAIVDVRTVNPLGLGGRDTVIEFSRRAVNVDGRWVIVTLMRDITEARRAEEEIRQRVAELTRSNQELEQFAYVTSHDLSEPLRMVASYTQLLSRRYADKFDDDGREFIKYAVDGAQRMKQLIDDLLMYSRAGRSKVPMRQIRLDRALDDALANLANAIERNGAVIERGPMPELVCEKAGLTQVFQNLVGNAIKFRGEAPPVVRITAVEDAQFWTISVADNGIGIAPEYFQRIFIIFQRLHSRTKYEGTGIGLSICKKIVERHGGQFTVASGPGQGTTFSFTLSKSLTESETP